MLQYFIKYDSAPAKTKDFLNMLFLFNLFELNTQEVYHKN